MDNDLSILGRIAQLGDHALKYGPFLFAIFFNLIVTNWAHRYYKTACTRKDPPATEGELTTYKYYFVTCGAFGISLVIASVWWWFNHQPAVFIYRGVITNLRDYENVTSSQLYFRKEWKEGPHPGAPQHKDHHFIVVKDKPFKPEETFELLYAKDEQNTGQTERFSLRYIPDQDEAPFSIRWDDNTSKYILVSMTTKKESGIAYAMTMERLTKHTLPANTITLIKTEISPLAVPPISLLAISSSGVHEKIAALDKLNELGTSYIRQYMKEAAPESRVLTLLDLTRHTDPELSSKATRLLHQNDPNPYIASLFFSTDPMEKQTAEQILYRIDRQRAEAVLEQMRQMNVMSKILTNEELNKHQRDIASGIKTRTIIPTGSRSGDLYYIRADWSGPSNSIGKCLASFLYSTINPGQHGESFEEYESRLSASTFYIVFAREKFQIIRIAELSEHCGTRTKMIGY